MASVRDLALTRPPRALPPRAPPRARFTVASAPRHPTDAFRVGHARGRHGARGLLLREGVARRLRRCRRRGKARVQRVPALGRQRGPGQALPRRRWGRGRAVAGIHRGTIGRPHQAPGPSVVARARAQRPGLVDPRARPAAARRGSWCVTTACVSSSSRQPPHDPAPRLRLQLSILRLHLRASRRGLYRSSPLCRPRSDSSFLRA